MAKYSRISNGFVDAIQKQPQPTLCTWEELCSIPNKDNYSLLENTISSSSIILKGFFQTAAQKALQNSQIDKAFELRSNTSRFQKENSTVFSTPIRKKS